MRATAVVVAAAVVVVVTAGGCRSRAGGQGAPAAAGVPLNATVPSATAIHNLNARIDLLDAQVRSGGDAQQAQERRELLVGLLMTRAQILGRLADYDRALALAEDGARVLPGDKGALVTRARIRERLHRFADALADLDAAVARGAGESSVEMTRASILGATGHEADAAHIMARHNADYPDPYSLGAQAIATARAGDSARATALFARARTVYRDVSPFPLAWLDHQEGRAAHDQGDLARARSLYEAALARIPEYAAAAGDLAELEVEAGPQGRARALALLRPLLAASDDPRYAADLSQMLAEADGGGADAAHAEAARLRELAARGYERLLAHQRAAFLDQAARFWLTAGNDPTRAAALAEENARLRPTAESRALLASARAATANIR